MRKFLQELNERGYMKYTPQRYFNEFISKGEQAVEESERKVVCPFHDDKKPSLGFIRGTKGIWRFHCFGCGVSGDVIEMHKQWRRKQGQVIQGGVQGVYEDLAKLWGYQPVVDVESKGEEFQIWRRYERLVYSRSQYQKEVAESRDCKELNKAYMKIVACEKKIIETEIGR